MSNTFHSTIVNYKATQSVNSLHKCKSLSQCQRRVLIVSQQRPSHCVPSGKVPGTLCFVHDFSQFASVFQASG